MTSPSHSSLFSEMGATGVPPNKAVGIINWVTGCEALSTFGM